MAVKSSLRSEPSISSPLINRLAEVDRAFHSWYRFVLSFPPHVVREYLLKFGVTAGTTILDPFCGTGTTLVESKLHGIPSFGLEANPIACLASQVKTNWEVDGGLLLKDAKFIADKCRNELCTLSTADEFERINEQPTLYGLCDLNEEQRSIILRDSISPRPLHRALVLKSHIEKADPAIQGHLLIALASTLVNSAGNLRFGPEVGVTKPKFDSNVAENWLSRVEQMAMDLQGICTLAPCPSRVFQADSREIPAAIPDQSIDFVFTSPPYPNEKDYTRTTRLESVVLGLINSRTDLRNLKQGLVRSNTRNVYVTDQDDIFVDRIPEIQHLAQQIEERRIQMNKTSGFERLYHRVTKLYFGGMARHFLNLRRVLKPGATLGYVVGDQASYLRVMIRTGQLLAQIAEQAGYEVVGIDLFRTRYATATREQLREEVVVLRWPGG